uniref:Uncharacterized protein n=1 Tax=Anguilla anguilla TaxID=7936 RepID=A0A0E9UE94_ANGAN
MQFAVLHISFQTAVFVAMTNTQTAIQSSYSEQNFRALKRDLYLKGLSNHGLNNN